MAKKAKFYVVWDGHQRGIFNTWKDCQKQIKGYSGAKYKSFESKSEAEAAFSKSYFDCISPSKKTKKTTVIDPNIGSPIWDTIAVDAACSGNPGKMEYQGVDTKTKKCLFHNGPFLDGTNNVGEFLALVHGLAFLKKHNSELPIYTDSKIAMGWIKAKKCKTNLKPNSKNTQIFDLIERAETWLKTNTYTNPILKWATKNWGEIPADFGRK